MAFLDKLTAAAKSARDSANTAIELGKLNMKIKTENDNIELFKTQIGDLLWARFQEGAVDDPQVTALCESIAAATAAVETLQKQVEELKAPAEPAEEAALAAQEEPAPILERHCTQCGAVVEEEARFCSSCGASLQ